MPLWRNPAISGSLVFDLDGTSYYLIYEPAGFQDWMVLGIVPTGVVNSSMNALQKTTLFLASGIFFDGFSQ